MPGARPAASQDASAESGPGRTTEGAFVQLIVTRSDVQWLRPRLPLGPPLLGAQHAPPCGPKTVP
jgi:hypothetical protein